MRPLTKRLFDRRITNSGVWLATTRNASSFEFPNQTYRYSVLTDEAAVGGAMFRELENYAAKTDLDIVIVLLGGRGAQAMYKIVNQKAGNGEIDELLGRLHVFTQDALAPMRMGNSLSFVRDFERLLGDEFFRRVKSFTPMMTETDDLEAALEVYLSKLISLGGIDIFFLGLGPEEDAASHLCYIKPGSEARFGDYAGIIPISSSILEHHISKFKAGGSQISPEDEAECRDATHILTLGPAAILSARKVVQSIVDASTAPAKRASFARLIETELSDDRDGLGKQLDANPGLWIRLHGNVSSYVLPDLV